MKVEKRKIEDLHAPERNTRLHNEKQIAEFQRSISMFGQIRPIVIDEDGKILAGNGLYAALVSMGRKEADCYVAKGLTETEKKKLMLADNRVFELGADDDAAIGEILAELGDDFDIPGYDVDDLADLLSDLADDTPDARPVSASAEGPAKAPEKEGNFGQSGFKYKPQYGVTVILQSEAEQMAAYEELSALGYTCRVVTV